MLVLIARNVAVAVNIMMTIVVILKHIASDAVFCPLKHISRLPIIQQNLETECYLREGYLTNVVLMCKALCEMFVIFMNVLNECFMNEFI